MATAKKESLDVEPAVKAVGANRQLMLKNSRAAGNWMRAKNALDREKRHYESKMNVDKTALLKQRERLHNATLSLNAVHEANVDNKVGSTAVVPKSAEETSASQPRRMTLADVYDSLIKSVREQKHSNGGDNRSVHSEPSNLSKASTASFDNKKIGRKPLHFTLQSLQQAQNSLQEKLQTIAQEEEDVDNDDANKEDETLQPSSPRGFFDLSEAEESLGPKLRLAPTILPPIRNQTVFKPHVRSFEHGKSNIQQSTDFEDLKYCRYIRGAVRSGRRNSAPVVGQKVFRLRQSTKPI